MATLLSPPSPFPNPPEPHEPLPHCSGDSQTPATAILHLSFNQDSTCFAAATDSGFRIYDCLSFRQILRRDLPSAAAAEMLFRSTAFALVGGDGGSNKVQIWEDRHARSIASLSFRSEVRSVRLHRERIVVAVLHKVFVYNFSDLRLVHQIETVANPSGLCAVSHVSGRMVLACPGLQKGRVRIEHYGLKKTRFVVAHGSMVASLALTQDGTLLATASTKGTLVRVFSTLDGSLLQELRRGADRAEIYSIAFSSAAQRLAVSSSKGTVHIFNLNVECRSSQDDKQQTSKPNPSTQSAISSLPFIRGVLPRYFSSECSVAKYRLQEGVRSIVAFGHQKNTVVIVGMDGSFRRCQFDPESGGDMTELEHYNFPRPEETL